MAKKLRNAELYDISARARRYVLTSPAEFLARFPHAYTEEQVAIAYDKGGLYPKVYDARTPATTPRYVTPEVLADEALSWIRRSTTWDLEAADRSLSEFPARFAKNPAHAFEWSRGEFQAAARQRVARVVLEFLDTLQGGDDYVRYTSVQALAKIAAVALRETISAARNPGRSTSETANAMSAAIGEAWANVAPRLMERLATASPVMVAEAFSSY